uniref:Uncharacterized protein n=1 Tax=viral metagenome TaxID=1070528 RepID=A0A6H1ZGC8_9ZZZZ
MKIYNRLFEDGSVKDALITYRKRVLGYGNSIIAINFYFGFFAITISFPKKRWKKDN